MKLECISSVNKKMGGIPSISFPPVLTCKQGCECIRKCYALRMANFHKSVGRRWAKNLEIWLDNPTQIYHEISFTAKVSKYFRYFVGGDIPDMAFFLLMVRIANENLQCKFLAFTKKYELVNAYLDKGCLPRNLHIVFSMWGKVNIPNPYSLPTSNVIFKGENAPYSDMICAGNCTECLCQGIGCWVLKKNERIWFYEH